VSAYTRAQVAKGIVQRGIVRLAISYGFHTKVLEQFELLASPLVGTMGVSVAPSGIRLLFNPEFVLGISADELGGVLLHEVHHVVLGHLLIDRSEFPDDWALTVALELSVNEFVHEPLPGQPITLQQFPPFPPMESSSERYQRLARVRDRQPLRGFVPNGKASKSGLEVVDDHGVWQQEGIDGAAVQRIVEDVVQQAELDAGGMPEELQAARVAGLVPGTGVQLISVDNTDCLDWQRLLRRYTGKVLKPRQNYHRPPRRFPELVGVVPGRAHGRSAVSVVAIIDTSASISSDQLHRISAELHRLSRTHPVHVIECDAAVRRVFRYRGPLQQVQGRGGTDFRPALATELLRPLRPGVLVYFTDGLGEAPERPPAWPLIWCLIPGGQRPAPYGAVIQIS
jgi:predicted metal-dependent peptidase